MFQLGTKPIYRTKSYESNENQAQIPYQRPYLVVAVTDEIIGLGGRTGLHIRINLFIRVLGEADHVFFHSELA